MKYCFAAIAKLRNEDKFLTLHHIVNLTRTSLKLRYIPQNLEKNKNHFIPEIGKTMEKVTDN